MKRIFVIDWILIVVFIVSAFQDLVCMWLDMVAVMKSGITGLCFMFWVVYYFL